MIEADNSLDLLTGVKVNVTTTNDDGTVTYQILEIDYKRLGGGGGGLFGFVRVSAMTFLLE